MSGRIVAFLCLIASNCFAQQAAVDINSWGYLNERFRVALEKAVPGIVGDREFLSVCPLPYSVKLASTDNDQSFQIADIIPVSTVTLGDQSRYVSSEFAAFIATLNIQAQPDTATYRAAYATLYQNPSLGSMLRNNNQAVTLTPLCLQYLLASEAVLKPILEAKYRGTPGSNHFVDGLLQFGAKSHIRDELQVMAQEDIRRAFWSDTLSAATEIRSSEWHAEGTTYFSPARPDWPAGTNDVWINFDVGDCHVELQMIVPLVFRTWFKWDLFQRKDWSWGGGQLLMTTLGSPDHATYEDGIAERLLPAVSTRLLIVKRVHTQGDLSALSVLSQWVSSMRADDSERAVICGVVSRKVPMVERSKKPADAKAQR